MHGEPAPNEVEGESVFPRVGHRENAERREPAPLVTEAPIVEMNRRFLFGRAADGEHERLHVMRPANHRERIGLLA